MYLSAELYTQCYETLLRCSEFDSYDSLQAIFVTPELSIYQPRLPQANNKEGLVSQTIAYLVRQRLSDQRSVFPIFLDVLLKHCQPGDALRDKLQELRAQAEQKLNEIEAIDIPFVIVAMTRNQADALIAGTALDHPTVAAAERTRCEEFREALEEHGINIANLPDSYGEAREDWRPQTSQKSAIHKIVWDIVDRINAQRSAAGSPLIRPKFLSSKFFDEDTKVETWGQLSQLGCVIIADAVSMFHPDLCHHLLHSEMSSNERVAMLVLSPVDPCTIPINQVIERAISSQMQRAFARFGLYLDKMCEFSAGDLRTLQRWLFSILPEVAETVQQRRANPSNLQLMQEQVGPELGMGDFLFGRRGG